MKKKLLAQPEPEHQLEQEQTPAAWITEWVQRYRYDSTPVMDRAVSFTKCSAPAVPNPNYIPLYTSPPKREPIDAFKAVQEFEGDYIYKDGFIDGIKYAEKEHGIGGGE